MADLTYTLQHDTSNVLMLPGFKKAKKDGKAVVAQKIKKVKKPLSNKQRKKLHKILERKQKKCTRTEILAKLQEHQISHDEIKLLSSVARIEQKTSKRKGDSSTETHASINSVQGSKRKKYINIIASDSLSTRSNLTSSGPYFETDSESSASGDELDQNVTVPVASNELRKSEPDLSAPAENQPSFKHIGHAVSDSNDELKNKSIKHEVVNKSNERDTAVDQKPVPKPTKYVLVSRPSEVQKSRLKLPILAMEQEIMESISGNAVVIICGATGSGKTTQVPQFLYEAGYCSSGRLIGITEPRRVAATSMSRRVGQELNCDSLVSYQIRYEGDVSDKTAIKFMTDGVLLRELKRDFLLSKYSAIVIDEAHERSIFSDILIGLLSRVVPLRRKRNMPDLRLIIMSATLRVEDFLSPVLFPRSPPVLNVEARQFPVSVHFSRQTPVDFSAAALKKCRQIHKKLPMGGILIFVPGQREVRWLVARLRHLFAQKNNRSARISEQTDDEEGSDDEMVKNTKKRKRRAVRQMRPISLNNYKFGDSDSATRSSYVCNQVADKKSIVDTIEDDFGQDEMDDGDLSEENEELDGEDSDDCSAIYPMRVLPLYALLSVKEQRKVFEEPPEGHRLCVVATNVAETSLTIPNIKYVIDTGKEKTRVYDPITGVSKFMTQWVSKASAEQRSGRAGRTSPGHCYRLYSSAVFEDFMQFSEPEILSKPADELVLIMKNMNIVKVVNFPFPTAPNAQVLEAAEERLCKLGALCRDQGLTDGKSAAKITPLGRTMALMPVSPSFARILALGHQENLLPYVVCIVSALSVREPLINLSSLGHQDKEQSMDKKELSALIGKHLEIRRQWASCSEDHLLLGDVACLLGAILETELSISSTTGVSNDISLKASEVESCSSLNTASSDSRPNFAQFCLQRGLRPQAMREIRRMRRQLTLLLNRLYPGLDLSLDPRLIAPSQDQACALRQILLGGLGAQVARRVREPLPSESSQGQEHVEKPPKNAYQCSSGLSDYVFIHPSSVLRKKGPDYVIYQEIIESSDKKFLFNVTAIEPEWLGEAAQAYCRFGDPLEEPSPSFDLKSDTIMCHQECLFGQIGWKLGIVRRPFPQKSIQFYKLLAKAFLNGEIFSELSCYVKNLLCNPDTMLKSWAPRLQRDKVESLLKSLIDSRVDSKARFLEIFRQNGQFLLDEYCKWLPEAKHRELQMIWPPGDL